MSRYSIVLLFLVIIVFISVFCIYLLISGNANKKFEPKTSNKVVPGSVNHTPWTQKKYSHNKTKSNGRGHIFNEDGECKLWGAANKIFNGTKAEIGDFPCMALLEYQINENEYSFNCAGSLINQRYVITAAHCLTTGNNPVNVRLGEFDLNNDPDCVEIDDCQPIAVNVGIDKIIKHENYSDGDPPYNDVGLVRLSIDVPYVDYFIRPICIPDQTLSTAAGKTVEVAGWGSDGIVKQSGILHKIQIPILDWNECHKQYADYKMMIDRSQMCARVTDGKDACKRDSGGPLIAKFNHRTYIEGIVSYGDGCGVQNAVPGIYTRVSYYYEWIKQNLEP